MSSPPYLKDDSVVVEASSAVPWEHDKSDNSQTKQDGSENPQLEHCVGEPGIEETTSRPPGSPKEGNQPALSDTEKSNDSTSSDGQNREDKNVFTSSRFAIDEVDSRRPDSLPGGSGSPEPATRRILLKRRRSRISTPTIGGTRNVAEEVDSTPPRAPKRRTQKKQMVALFLDSDFPRKK